MGTAAAAMINAVSHHEFVVLETSSGRGVSVEKLDDGLVIQNADDPLKLVEWQLSYKRKCVQGMKEGAGPVSGNKLKKTKKKKTKPHEHEAHPRDMLRMRWLFSSL